MMRKLLFLPKGVEIREKTDRMPLEMAANLLRSRSRRRVSTAVRHPDDTVTLTRHVWRCPFCGEERPAYYRNLIRMYRLQNRPPEVYDAAALEEWSSPQIAMFDRESTFKVNVPILRPRGLVQCPSCYRYVQDKGGYHVVEITETNHAFSLIVALSEEDTAQVKKRQPDLPITPLMETLTFDVEKHTVTLKWGDGMRTYTAPHWSMATATADLIEQYHVLKHALKRILVGRWHGRPFPFHNQELTTNIFALLTCFTGFDRRFYDSLPFEGASFRLDPSFAKRLEKLTSVSAALLFLRGSDLPYITAMRFHFFIHNQGLLLYIPECEVLWSLMQGDVNTYDDLLSRREIFELLLWMHVHREGVLFLKDYVGRYGPRALMDWMEGFTNAKLYTSRYGRQKTQLWNDRQEWRCRNRKRMLSHNRFMWWTPSEVSIPLKSEDVLPAPSYLTDGYFFHYVGSRRELLEVDRELRICTDCRSTGPCVYAVHRAGYPVALIETKSRREIASVRGFFGMSVAEPSFRTAFERWCRRFSLAYAPSSKDK